MKKFFFSVLILLLLVASGIVWLVMRSFNAEAYQQQVISAVSELTGRQFQVLGATSFTWRPVPTFTMENVQLSNQEGSEEPLMFHADRIRIEIELTSLLSSPLVVRRVEVEKPTLLLERLPNNHVNYAFSFLFDPTKQLHSDFASMDAGNTRGTRIDTVSIDEGTLIYANSLTKTFQKMTDISGELNVDSLVGPFRFNGRGVLGKNTYRFSGRTGSFQGGQPVDFSLKVAEPNAGMEGEFSGKFTPSQVNSIISGDGHFNLQKPSQFSESVGLKPLPADINKPIIGNFSVELTPAEDHLKTLTVRFGEEEKDLALSVSVLRQNTMAKTSLEIKGAINGLTEQIAKPYLEQFNWASLKKEENLGLTLKADLTLPTFRWYNQDITDVQMKASFQEGTLTLDTLSATLPGETKITSTGTATALQVNPFMELNLVAQTGSLRTLLGWLYPQMPLPTHPGVLGNASAQGVLRIEPDKWQFTVAEGKVDDTELNGILSLSQAERPTILVNLMLVNINADPYIGYQVSSEKKTPSEVLSGLMRWAEGNKLFASFDARFELEFNEATLFNLPMPDGGVIASLKDNVLTLETFVARNVATASLLASGTISGFGTPNVNIADVSFEMEATQLPLFMERAQLTSSYPLIQTAQEASFAVQASGAANKWTINGVASLNKALLKINGDLARTGTMTLFQNTAFEMTHPDFHAFMKLVKPDFEGFPKLTGGFKASGVFSGSEQSFEIQNGELSIGIQKLLGRLSYTGKETRQLNLTLQAPSLDMAQWLPDFDPIYSPQSGFSIKPFALDGWDAWNLDVNLKANQLLIRHVDLRQAEMALSLRDKTLMLSRLKGLYKGEENTAVDISGSFVWSSTPVLDMTVKLDNIGLRQDFMIFDKMGVGSGLLSSSFHVRGEGESPWAMISSMTGEGTLSLKNNTLFGVDLEQVTPIITRALQTAENKDTLNAQIAQAIQSGRTPLNSIVGRFSMTNGVLRMQDGVVKTPSTIADPTRFVLDFPKQSIDLQMPVKLTAFKNLPVFSIQWVSEQGSVRYVPDFSALLQSVSDVIQNEVSEAAAQQQEQKLKEANERIQERQKQAAAAAEEATTRVRQVEDALLKYPSEQAELPLQSARDALEIVTQLSVKEYLSDAQYIQLIEQARLAVKKAEEAELIMNRGNFAAQRDQITRALEAGKKMTQEIETLALQKSYIDILDRLAKTARQNLSVIQNAADITQNKVELDQANNLVSVSIDALAQIEQAHEAALRYNVPETAGGSKVIKGRIGRARP